MKMKLSKKKIIPIGIAVAAVLALVGTVGALNGWFGGAPKEIKRQTKKPAF